MMLDCEKCVFAFWCVEGREKSIPLSRACYLALTVCGLRSCCFVCMMGWEIEGG